MTILELGGILRSIYLDLELSEEKLFLFTYLDEIQKLAGFNWRGPIERERENGAPTVPEEGLSPQILPTASGLSPLKEILYHLGSCMSDRLSKTFAQTFISGTARSAVISSCRTHRLPYTFT